MEEGSQHKLPLKMGKFVLEWFDNQPEDTCQRWDKKQKHYVSDDQILFYEYNNKMGGVDLTGRMISYYRMSGHFGCSCT